MFKKIYGTIWILLFKSFKAALIVLLIPDIIAD